MEVPLDRKEYHRQEFRGGEGTRRRANTPAAFDPYKGARAARAEQPNPAKWVDEWPVPGLCSEHRDKIKAALWRADAAFAKSPGAAGACPDSMRYAFVGIAQLLFDAGILTEQLLQKDIPLLVWDSAIAAGWWRFASETRQDIFPEELGHYWVWRDDGEDWPGLFRAEAAEWRSKLLDGPIQRPEQRDAAEAKSSRKSPAQLLNEYKVTNVSEPKNLSPRTSVWSVVSILISRPAGRLATKPISKRLSASAACQAT